MRGWIRIGAWLLLLGACAWMTGCQTAETLVLTRLVETEVTRQVAVSVEVTRVVIQEREATRIVEVTPTPTPIPTGGFLVAAVNQDVTSLNPLLTPDDGLGFVRDLLYGSMFEVDAFSGEWVCHFCQEWTADGRSFTLTMRDGLAWSDGQPLSVDDFLYTYSALFWAQATGGLDSPQLDLLDELETIERLDERTARVTLNRERCDAFPYLNLRWLPRHLYGPDWQYSGPVNYQGPFGDADDPDFASIAGSKMNTAPQVASGPFVFDEWVPGDHLTLRRNPRYFRGAAHLDGVVIRLVPEERYQVLMLRTGEVDVVGSFSPQYLTEVELQGGVQVFKVPADSYIYLALQLGNPSDPQPRWLEDEDSGAMALNDAHGEHPILRDVRVRQAIAYALDRNAIINRVVVGQAVPLYSNLLPSLSWAFHSELEPYDYDPDRAVALLEEAGWTLNAATGIREQQGRPLRLDLQTNNSSEIRVQIGESVAAQLKQVGIDARFEAMEWGSFVGLVLGQQFDLVILSWIDLGNEPDDSAFFASEYDTPTLGFNFVSYYDPELDKAWTRAATLPGCQTDERAEIYRQIQATLHRDLPYNWLYAPLKLIGATRRVGGFNPGPWSTWHDVERWYLTAE